LVDIALSENLLKKVFKKLTDEGNYRTMKEVVEELLEKWLKEG